MKKRSAGFTPATMGRSVDRGENKEDSPQEYPASASINRDDRTPAFPDGDSSGLWLRPYSSGAGWASRSPRSESRNGIPYRTLGRSEEKVSLVGLGGYHLGNQKDPQESIRIIRTGLDEGVNFLDNCWDYNGGESEIRMGKALRDGYRQKAFLMSKIDGRTKAAAATQINESLRPTPD